MVSIVIQDFIYGIQDVRLCLPGEDEIRHAKRIFDRLLPRLLSILSILLIYRD